MPKSITSLYRVGYRYLPSNYLASTCLCVTLTAMLALPALATPLECSGVQAALLSAAGAKLEESNINMVENDRAQTPDGKSYQITRTTINAAPADVFAVLVDYNHSRRLFNNLTKSEVLSRDEKNKTSTVSFSLRGIMNLWSFDYVLSIKENFPTSIDFHRISGTFKRNEGYWKLLPLDNGRRTEVVYAKYLDAGSLVPPQIVARQVQESIACVVQNLKRVAENPNFKLASHR